MIGTGVKIAKDVKAIYEKVKKGKKAYAIFSLDEVTILTFKRSKFN